jgi:capsule biosynthesis phosphatase
VRICFDIDGVIATLKLPNQDYSQVFPVEGAPEAIRGLRLEGHEVILYTARHMKTTNGNVAKVLAREGKILLDWLEEHGIEYDEILFGKPYADLYVDDNALRFISWKDFLEDSTFRNLIVKNKA